MESADRASRRGLPVLEIPVSYFRMHTDPYPDESPEEKWKEQPVSYWHYRDREELTAEEDSADKWGIDEEREEQARYYEDERDEGDLGGLPRLYVWPDEGHATHWARYASWREEKNLSLEELRAAQGDEDAWEHLDMLVLSDTHSSDVDPGGE